MGLNDNISPWSGQVYRHIPDGSPYAVTDFRFAGVETDNRWNQKGERTLYLASDPGLAVGELARHLTRDYSPDAVTLPVRRRIFRLTIRLDAVLDFTTPEAWSALGGLPEPPRCFLDKAIARAVAHYIRTATTANAMRVPSVAFLDDLTRWSLVVFLAKLPADPATFIVAADDVGIVHIGRDELTGG